MLDVNVFLSELFVENVMVKAAHWAAGKHRYVGTETGRDA